MDIVELIQSKYDAKQFFVHKRFTTVSTLPRVTVRGHDDFDLSVPHTEVVHIGGKRIVADHFIAWSDVLDALPNGSYVRVPEAYGLRIRGEHLYRKDLSGVWEYRGYTGEE